MYKHKVNRTKIHEDNPDNPVYLGTSLGVYRIDDTETSWGSIDNNLPNSPVRELEISYTSGEAIMTAGTYGRGIWQT